MGGLLDYEQPTNYIVSNDDYDDSYPTPVLTAGKSFLLGYSKDTENLKLASPNNPVIIFDDFTTNSHFVDFPFKVKSSALKILDKIDKEDSVFFFFNLLQTINFIPGNHQRHWISLFSNFKVFVPTQIKERDLIVNLFSDLDNLITSHQRQSLINNKLERMDFYGRLF